MNEIQFKRADSYDTNTYIYSVVHPCSSRENRKKNITDNNNASVLVDRMWFCKFYHVWVLDFGRKTAFSLIKLSGFNSFSPEEDQLIPHYPSYQPRCNFFMFEVKCINKLLSLSLCHVQQLCHTLREDSNWFFCYIESQIKTTMNTQYTHTHTENHRRGLNFLSVTEFSSRDVWNRATTQNRGEPERTVLPLSRSSCVCCLASLQLAKASPLQSSPPPVLPLNICAKGDSSNLQSQAIST